MRLSYWSVEVLKAPILHHSIIPFGITLIPRSCQIAAADQEF